MGRETVWIGVGAGLLVVIAGVGWDYFGGRWDKKVMGGDEQQAMQKFTGDCMSDLLTKHALRYGNTYEQITATCDCFGREIYPVFKDMTMKQAQVFSTSVEGREQARSVIQKCINKIGLDGAAEWFTSRPLDDR